MQWRLKSPASPLFTQLFIQAQVKENIKAPRHRWPVNSRTNSQWRGKCFHLMTSSWFKASGTIPHMTIQHTDYDEPIIGRGRFVSFTFICSLMSPWLQAILYLMPCHVLEKTSTITHIPELWLYTYYHGSLNKQLHKKIRSPLHWQDQTIPS